MELLPRAAESLDATLATEHDLRNIVTGLIELRGSQKAVADDLGISQAYLGDVLRGRRGVGEKMAEKLGWEKIEIFRRK